MLPKRHPGTLIWSNSAQNKNIGWVSWDLGSIWEANGTAFGSPDREKSSKEALGEGLEAHLRKTSRKHRFSDPPEPSKSCWDCSESSILTCVPGPLKVIKNSPKVTLLEPSGLQKWPRSRRKYRPKARDKKKGTKKVPQKDGSRSGTLEHEASRAR